MSNEFGRARPWPNLRYIPAYVWRAALLQKGRKNLQHNASDNFAVVERLKCLTKQYVSRIALREIGVE